MSNKPDEIISQIHMHNAAAQKAARKSLQHQRASCRLQCQLLEEHGLANGVSDDVIAMSLAPKRED